MLNRVDYKPVPFHSIREMLDLAVADCPDRDAYQFTMGDSDEIIHVTYSSFYDITENLGAALTELGLGSSHIACLSENSFDWICAYITVLKSAGVFIPVDGDLPAKDKIHVTRTDLSETTTGADSGVDHRQDHTDILTAETAPI